MSAALVVGVLVLWLGLWGRSAASAQPVAHPAADQLLETMTVDTAKTTVTTGTVGLKAGTEYQLQVSGTFTITGPGGQGFNYDALYCYGSYGFLPGTPDSCQPPLQNANFYVGVGSSSLKETDAYQEPNSPGTSIGYGITHRYNTNFYPPVDGTLSAGGEDAFTHCKSDPTPCQDVISGTITIQIYGPVPPPPPPRPPNPCGQVAQARPKPPRKPCPPLFASPASAWGLPTNPVTLTAGVTAVEVSSQLAKGQDSASATVTGTADGNTQAEFASLLEKARIAKCIGVALAVATPEKKSAVVRTDPTTGLTRLIKQAEYETDQEVAVNFFLALLMCVDDLKHQAGHHAADASAAGGCPVRIEGVSIKELDLKQIRYRPTGPGHTPGLTTTCTRNPTGLTVHLHSHGTDLRSIFGSRLVLGLYQPTGTATAQVTFGNGAAPPPTWTGTWNTTYGPMNLTQSGNQVTGTYTICNGAATISGTVAGLALDGTWTEPCDSGQGRIHFVLSADGKSFMGLWGVGNAIPSAPWNGTRS